MKQRKFEQNIKILNEKERNGIIEILKKQFGINEIPGEIIKKGEEKIFLYTGSLNRKEIYELNEIIPLERIGTYFAKEEEFGIRLSIEGSQIIKSQIKKNIVELNKEEMETWMMGHEVLKNSGFNGYVIIKFEEDMLGTGKASEEKITNFIPKSRRLRDRTIEK